MTVDKKALIELVKKAADADLVREMLDFAAKRMMEAEVRVLSGAARGARDPTGQQVTIQARNRPLRRPVKGRGAKS